MSTPVTEIPKEPEEDRRGTVIEALHNHYSPVNMRNHCSLNY